MYMTMSISTGLYLKLDLLTANKLLTYLVNRELSTVSQDLYYSGTPI